MTQPNPTPCDGCDKPLTKTEQRLFRGLILCASCFISENAALAAPIVPPPTTSAYPPAALVRKPTGNGKTFSALHVQQELTRKLQDYISMNHMEFFNQEIEEVKDLSIEELRARIEEMAEAYFGAEAEAIRKKTKMQAASQVFNDKTSKLSATERESLRVKDASYSPTLVNPLKTKSSAVKKTASTAKTKKSLEDGLAALFGDKAEEAMKKLLG